MKNLKTIFGNYVNFIIFIFLISFILIGGFYLDRYTKEPNEQKQALPDIISENGTLLSKQNSFEVKFPKKPNILNANMKGLKITAYQCITPLGVYNVHVHYMGGKIISEESKNAYFENYIRSTMNMHKDSKLVKSERIIFLGKDALKSKIQFEYLVNNESVTLYRDSISLLTEGDISYTLSIIYKAIDKNKIISYEDNFFNSFKILGTDEK